MSKEKLKKAREFEQEQLKKISPDGLMIQMDFPFIKTNIICFISIIHILMNGDRCTGVM